MVHKKVLYMLPVLFGFFSCFGMQLSLSEKAQGKLNAIRTDGSKEARAFGVCLLDGVLPEEQFLAELASLESQEEKADAARAESVKRLALLAEYKVALATGNCEKVKTVCLKHAEAQPGVFSRALGWKIEKLPMPWGYVQKCADNEARDALVDELLAQGFDINVMERVLEAPSKPETGFDRHALSFALDPMPGSDFSVDALRTFLAKGADPTIKFLLRKGLYPKNSTGYPEAVRFQLGLNAMAAAILLNREAAYPVLLGNPDLRKKLATDMALQVAGAKGDINALCALENARKELGRKDFTFLAKACSDFRNPEVLEWALSNGYYDHEKAVAAIEAKLKVGHALSDFDMAVVDALLKQEGWSVEQLETLVQLAAEKYRTVRKVDADDRYKGLITDLEMRNLRNSEAYRAVEQIRDIIQNRLLRTSNELRPVCDPELPLPPLPSADSDASAEGSRSCDQDDNSDCDPELPSGDSDTSTEGSCDQDDNSDSNDSDDCRLGGLYTFDWDALSQGFGERDSNERSEADTSSSVSNDEDNDEGSEAEASSSVSGNEEEHLDASEEDNNGSDSSSILPSDWDTESADDDDDDDAQTMFMITQ